MKYWENKGAFQTTYDEMYKKKVPVSGKSDTMGGEALRAVSRMYYDCYNNGWCNNTSGAWHFLNNELDTRLPGVRDALGQLEPLVNTGGYSDFDDPETQEALDLLVDAVVLYNQNDPLANREAYDMFDLQDPEVCEDDDEEYMDDDYWDDEVYGDDDE